MFTYDQYAADVLAGKVPACRYIRQAVERQARDLVDGPARGLRFDQRAARMPIAFFHSYLRHSKGEWAGQPVKLEPWQQWHLAVLFGWLRADGSRRFRTSYLEIGRKNGKSTLAAGVGLYLLAADREPGAEIYTAATKLKQARLIHSEAIRMVKQSPALGRVLSVLRDNINYKRNYSKFEPLGRDSETEDGLNVHAALIDEFHAHKSGSMWDVLETATSARRQPLMYAITTAGDDRASVCYQYHEYTAKVLSGVIDDDAFFGMIYSLDRQASADGVGEGELEDWTVKENWVKANPNLGVSKKQANMEDLARKAKNIPARLGAFLQKDLNVWIHAGGGRWILPEKWSACDRGPLPSIDELAGRRAYGGLDLSSTRDLTAWCLVFEPEEPGGLYDILCTQWIPEENIKERSKRDRVPYDAWLRDGHIIATPGDVIDQDYILDHLRADLDRFNIQRIAFDPWDATKISNTLTKEGAPMVKFRQYYSTYNPAMKALEIAVFQHRVNHAGDPVLAWNMDNVITSKDRAGNIMPDKSKSREKIDGAAALIMSYYQAELLSAEADDLYEDYGIIVL